MEDKIIDYVTQTPENTNPAVLHTLLGDLNKQSDWNQNDPTALDYIKNRPFYEETTETVMLPETSFEIVAGTHQAIISNSFPYTFEIDKEYTVTFDGVTNTYTAIAAGSSGALTNTSLNESAAGNGWLISAGDGGVGLITRDSSLVGAHTISISGSVNTVHKIDRKFIPATEKEDKPLYENSGALSATSAGGALDAALLAELLETKHCYILYSAVNEMHMEILSYTVYRTNNVVKAVKCYFINSSTGNLTSTQNGEIPEG